MGKRLAMPSMFLRMILVCAALMFVAGTAQAQSPEKLAAADRLIAAQDLKSTMRDMAAGISGTLPPEQRQTYIDFMTGPAFLERVSGAARKSMAKHFTVEEMDALTEFYSKPIAKSAMAKMATTWPS